MDGVMVWRVLLAVVAYLAVVGLAYGIMEGSWLSVLCAALALVFVASIVLAGDA